MKKGKFLSILTSLAMTGTMMLSAIPFSASAADSPVGLEMVSDKTTFTLEEVQAGATATVYVNSTNAITEADEIATVEFALKPEEWGKVDPVNLELCWPNQLSSAKGNGVFNYYTTATAAASMWTKDKPTDMNSMLYQLMNYCDDGATEYSDSVMPKIALVTSSGNGYIRTEDANAANSIAKFEVEFPTDLAEGTYTINFASAQTCVGRATEENPDGQTIADITDATGITFTIGDADTTTATTPAVTTTATTAETEVSWSYVGSCDLKAETSVEAEAGETVQVPIYIDTFGKTVEGMGALVTYDADALELVSFINPLETEGNCGLFPPSLELVPSTGVFLCTILSVPMTNDPSVPLCIAEFKVKEDAEPGEYEIGFDNNLHEGTPIEVIQEAGKNGSPNLYLEVTSKPGSIVVAGEVTSTEEETDATTTTTKATTTESDVVVTKTSVSDVVVTETSKSVVVVTETSISDVVVTKTSESEVVVTKTSESEVVVTKTSVSDVVVTKTSESEVVVTKTSVSDVVVTKTSESVVVVTKTSEVEVVVTVTNVSGVVVTSISNSMVVVTETSIPDTTDVSDTDTSDVSDTDTSDVSDSSDTTASETTTSETTTVSISIVFSTDAVDLKGNNAFWYFADETAWHLDAFAVEVNGEVVDGAELTFSAASPKEAYDGKTFDYEITVTYKHADGTEVSATFTAKIGQRGDANLDHAVNARDAATIARDLAQLYSTKKSTLTAEDGFGIFLANSDFVYSATPELGKNGYAKTPTDAYGQYDFAVRDAATLAKYLSRVYSEKTLTLYDVAVAKK